MSEQSERPTDTCQRCGRKPASVHVRKVSGGGEEHLHVCLDCSKELGAEPGGGGMLSDPLTILFRSMEETGGTGAVCPGCGLTFDRFKETGRLGCIRCFETFSAELRPLLRRIHGSVRHTGKTPRREGPEYEEAARFKRLSQELERAVSAEDYERAAELRDRLRELDAAQETPREKQS